MNYIQVDTDIVYCDDAFVNEELLTIRTIGDQLETLGQVDTSTGDGTSRKLWNVGLRHAPQNTVSFIYKRISTIAKEVNTQHFNFEIEEIFEGGFWYSTYTAPTDRLDWHADKTDQYGDIKSTIKLSFVLQLSNPSEYEGGTVEAMTDDGIKVLERKMGRMYIMPGYLAHRVTPVTVGQRRVLVAWYVGPKFK